MIVDLFDQPDPTAGPAPPDRLEDEVRAVIRDADAHSHRSVQTALGPSEVWMDCTRRQAYRLAGWPTINFTADPWAAIVGTATHAWLADAFTRANKVLGRIRWVVEKRVIVRPGLSGVTDLYDTDCWDAIDHKVMGDNSMDKVRKSDGVLARVSEQYRRQLHLYGLGWENLGIPPRRVVLMAYPRGGLLAGVRAVSEPYNRDLALEALDRMDRNAESVRILDVHNHPERFAAIPASPGHICTYCPFWNARAQHAGQGCRGMLERAA